MLDKLLADGNRLSQEEYDGLANLLDTILTDLYGATNENEQTDSRTDSQSPATTSENLRVEQRGSQEANRSLATYPQAVLGYPTLPKADEALLPLVNIPITSLTQSDVQSVINQIATLTNVPSIALTDNLLDSPLLDEGNEGTIIDLVYDEVGDVWVWADEYNPTQQGALNEPANTPNAPSGQPALNAPAPSGITGNRAISTANARGTPALEAPSQAVQRTIYLGT